MIKTIEIDEDYFTEMVYDRIAEYGSKFYDMDFWEAVVNFFSKEIGWDAIKINDRDPKIIVDNISVNGEIYTTKEVCKMAKKEGMVDEKDEEEKTIKEIAEEYAENKPWYALYTKDEIYYIVNWGF